LEQSHYNITTAQPSSSKVPPFKRIHFGHYIFPGISIGQHGPICELWAASTPLHIYLVEAGQDPVARTALVTGGTA